MIFYLSIFIIFGLLGWLLDTAYRTWEEGRYVSNTLLPFFSVIYGYAAVMLHILFTFSSISVFGHIIIGTVMSVFLELISGILALFFLKKRFWDYQCNKLNFYGFIDVKHTVFWLVLVSLYRVIYPFLF